MIVALQFERDIVGPTLGAFDKTIVEGGHRSWRIYTKAAQAAVSAATPALSPNDARYLTGARLPEM
jgi:hypothetical protein